jgi:head-tail adaptor
MLAWRLRHRVEVQRQIESQDPQSGEIKVVWQTVELDGVILNSVPAEVLTGAGREFLESSSRQSETTARINMRWFPVDRIEILKYRILWDGRVFNITSAETDRTARQEWRLKCVDGVSDGR